MTRRYDPARGWVEDPDWAVPGSQWPATTDALEDTMSELAEYRLWTERRIAGMRRLNARLAAMARGWRSW